MPLRSGPPLFLSWGAIGGRAAELAEAVDGRALCCFPPGPRRRPPVLVRYALSLVWTVAYLLWRRPSAVVVTNPPIFPALAAVVYGRLTRAPVLLDDHPGSFGAQGYAIGRWMTPVHRWLVARARLTLVTAPEWADLVQRWGGKPLILHESPGTWTSLPPPGPREQPRVLFVCTFAPDEPAEAVLAAARVLDGVTVAVTGDTSRCPPGWRDLPPNLEPVGFLPPEVYRNAMAEADVVMSLTTEPTSAMRAAFEATWAEKPLIVSDWPLSEHLFPQAVRVDNTPAGIAAGIMEAVSNLGGLAAAGPLARQDALDRWTAQREALHTAMSDAAVK